MFFTQIVSFNGYDNCLILMEQHLPRSTDFLNVSLCTRHMNHEIKTTGNVSQRAQRNVHCAKRITSHVIY